MKHLNLIASVMFAALAACSSPAVGTCEADFECESDQRCCAGACIDVSSSADHCGRCSAPCSAPSGDAQCVAGVCKVSCGAGRADCNTTSSDGCEVTVADDPRNCGGCGVVCTSMQNTAAICTMGQCGMGDCVAGFGNCDGDASNGCEISTDMNAGHCGACGQVCEPQNAFPLCLGGECRIGTCQSGFADCNRVAADGCEQDINTNEEHCGGCGVACDPSRVCRAGTCASPELVGFGGREDFASAPASNATWRFNLEEGNFVALSPLTPQGLPAGRYGHVAFWDAAASQMIVWGGGDEMGVPVDIQPWALGFVTPPTWRPLETTGTPAPRSFPAADFDPVARKLYVFGGRGANLENLGDFWVLDVATGGWTQLHGPLTSGGPMPRAGASGALNADRTRFIVFGGQEAMGGTELGDLWSFDLTAASPSWTELTPTGGPTGRLLANAFGGSDPLHFFGGYAGGTANAELWALSLSPMPVWTQLTPVSQVTPSERYMSASASSDTRRFVFGGGSSAARGAVIPTNDLWSYDVQTNAWTELKPAGAPGSPAAPMGASMVVTH